MMILGIITLALMAAPPATQTCPDGSVILATEECAAPPPPATQTCPDGAVILATDTCPEGGLAELSCTSTGGSKSPLAGDLYIGNRTMEFDLEDGRSYTGETDVSDPKVWRSQMWIDGQQSSEAFEISDVPDESGVYATKLGSVSFACRLY